MNPQRGSPCSQPELVPALGELQGLWTQVQGIGRAPGGTGTGRFPTGGCHQLLHPWPQTWDVGQEKGHPVPTDLGAFNYQLCHYSSDPSGKSLLLSDTQLFLP